MLYKDRSLYNLSNIVTEFVVVTTLTPCWETFFVIELVNFKVVSDT